MAGPAGGAGQGADRHQESADQIQQGLRLLFRGDQFLQEPGAGGLYPQADPGQRGAVHHAEAEGVRGHYLKRRGQADHFGVRTVLQDSGLHRHGAGQDTDHRESGGEAGRVRIPFPGVGAEPLCAPEAE